MNIRDFIWVLVVIALPVQAAGISASGGSFGGRTGSTIMLRADALPYPTGPLTVDQIVQQVYQASHGGLIDNAVSRRHKREIALLVNRAPLDKRGPGRKPGVNTFETFINNNPLDHRIKAQQMAVMKSGKVKGTGVLFTEYTDKSRGATIALWLPALRKIRRINEPAHEDYWVGSNFTYGELVLRRPEHEDHELLGEVVFEDCLLTMELDKSEMTRHTKKLPKPQCEHKGKAVYRVKSTTKFKNWWYDYHISDIDKKTFSMYRTEYFKDGEKVKTITVDWQSLNHPDPRVNYPRYIYALTHKTGVDSLVYVPRSTVELNVNIPDSFWSEDSLKQQGKK
jgi:hypothetical protein